MFVLRSSHVRGKDNLSLSIFCSDVRPGPKGGSPKHSQHQQQKHNMQTSLGPCAPLSLTHNAEGSQSHHQHILHPAQRNMQQHLIFQKHVIMFLRPLLTTASQRQTSVSPAHPVCSNWSISELSKTSGGEELCYLSSP